MPDRRAASRRTRPIRVLLVEDNIDHQMLLQRRLEDGGAQVWTASTGIEALRQLDDVDLVLLDYQLPDVSGLEMLDKIEAFGGPSVVMVTGMGSESIAVDAMRAGAIDYVVKDSTYLSMIGEIVERAWRHHDVRRRAGKLQEVALLVNEADDRDTIFQAIVGGARELLDADSCALALSGESKLEIVATTGAADPDLESTLAQAADAADAGATIEDAHHLFVPLTKGGQDRLGALIVRSPDDTPFSAEERQLVETFASFAALAVSKLRRHELERSLIMELQQTLEMRRDFVNSISHELRTPLACISGFSTTLLNYWGRLDEPTTKASVEKIQQHSGDLAALVDALLDFGTVEQGRFKPEVMPTKLRHELEESVESLRPVLDGREVHVDADDTEVLADPRLVRRIISHLASNAVKATETGSAIDIRTRSLDGEVRVEVKDRGHGMTDEEVRRAFEPFWRSRSSIKAAKRGTGLGLALVREYARAMGGEAGLESRTGEGTTAWFTLPRA